MNRYQTIGSMILCGAAAIALAGCQPAGPADIAQTDAVTPAQQDAICLQAVKDETGNSQALVLFSDHSGGVQEIVNGRNYDSIVTVGVGPDNTQYHCLVDNSGVVGDIHALSAVHSGA